ncbi:divergent polysaccharide deacetylase family protein [Nitratifractor sp.]|uniref:divergent polysaccharide deacetylase family protein n=1 Tax=Nitratifractor sp. TaxID=2268144 RepID=UPI0025E7B145|nr:divergent polysaccharide deacetylase family protein [Nitratifractor sp.]
MRRTALSVLGLLTLSTLLGFSFLIAGKGEKASVPPPAKPKPASIKKSAIRPKAPTDSPIVGEEYPEEKIGFGLEDLIAKTKKRAKVSRESKVSEAILPKEHHGRPQLVLIIDDVSQPRQLAAIRALPYHITPSIFPPSRMNRHTPTMAQGLKHFMIHLPLESGSAKMNRFTKTLFVDDGPARFEKRVKEIRRLFPSARFLNNHTGSVFTSNYGAMYHLYGDLKKEGFIFLDSRTTGHSVVRRVAAAYHTPYLSRDIFLDNVQNRAAILHQLKRAVRIAQKRGYAIAIGHPHRATLDALRHAGKILSGVETVYIDNFYRSRYGR